VPRLDRMATLCFFAPLQRALREKAGIRVPILMYHSVSDNLFGRSHPYFQINTLPQVFLRQIRWLHQNGYRTISMREMLSTMQSGEKLPKRIVITFNRGYQDFYK